MFQSNVYIPWQEVPYNPLREDYKDVWRDRLNSPSPQHLIIVGIDLPSHQVYSIREITLSQSDSIKWLQLLDSYKYSATYESDLESVYDRYPVNAIAKLSPYSIYK